MVLNRPRLRETLVTHRIVEESEAAAVVDVMADEIESFQTELVTREEFRSAVEKLDTKLDYAVERLDTKLNYAVEQLDTKLDITAEQLDTKIGQLNTKLDITAEQFALKLDQAVERLEGAIALQRGEARQLIAETAAQQAKELNRLFAAVIGAMAVMTTVLGVVISLA